MAKMTAAKALTGIGSTLAMTDTNMALRKKAAADSIITVFTFGRDPKASAFLPCPDSRSLVIICVNATATTYDSA